MTGNKKPQSVAADKGFDSSEVIETDYKDSIDSDSNKLSNRLERYYIAKQRALVNQDYLTALSDQSEAVNQSLMDLIRAIIPYARKHPEGFSESRHQMIISTFREVLETFSPGTKHDFDYVEPTLKGYIELSECLLDYYKRYSKAAKGIRSCGNYLVFHQYYTVGKTKLAKSSFCKQHLLCPLCAIRRSAKTLKAYLDKYSLVMEENPSYRLSMITLTVKNGDDLKERFEHLKKSQSKLFQHRKDYLKTGWGNSELRKVHGWVGTYEFTNKGKGWHPHSHIMVLHTEDFNYSALIREWKEITGDSCNVNVTSAKNPDAPEKDFIEVFKYAVKFSDLAPNQNIHAWNVLRGKRLLFSGGALYGIKVPDSMTDDLLDDLPYIELFYKASLAGYQLESSVMKEAEIKDVEILPFSRVTLDYLSNRVLNQRNIRKTKKFRIEGYSKQLQSDFKLGYEAYSKSERPPKGKRVQFYKGWYKHRADMLLVEP